VDVEMKKIILAAGIFIMLISSTLTITVAADEPLIRLPGDKDIVKMKAQYAGDSWFHMTLSEVPDGYDITDGMYLGWCVQVAVNMTLNVNHAVKLYSSYDSGAIPNSDNWDKVNWIINNYNGYGRQAIQEVIWFFICDDPLPENNTDAKELAAAANESGAGFIPTYGEKIAVVANVESGGYPVQHTFIEVILRNSVPLGDLVWNDSNKNGIQDEGEPGIEGVTVRLLNEMNETNATTTTNTSGYYSFSGFPEGNYSLQFSLKNVDYHFSPANQGSDDSLDSDVDQTGKTPFFLAFTGTNDMSWDAGMYYVKPSEPGGGGETPPPETPTNTPPTADGMGPYVALFGDTIMFNGSRSYDHDGTIVSWVWTFGDGTTGNGSIVNHTYANPGFYIVTLKVTDNDDATDTYTTNATVREPNQPPLPPTLTGSSTGSTDENYVLRIVTTDPNNDNIRYFISWGDGTDNVTSYLQSGQNTQRVHQWSSWGFFTIQVYAEEEYTEHLNSNISSLVVAVDVHYVGSQGYLIDTDSDGIYDAFYSNSTGMQTPVQRQQTGVYLIDLTGDGNFDYQYDPATGSHREYPEALSPSYTMLLIGVAVVVIILLLVGFFLRRRGGKPKQ
jgi:hypothetical protein